MPASRTVNENNDIFFSRTHSRKKRIRGACDICKRKKIKCDSGEMAGNKCSYCIQYGFECTHKEATKSLGTAKGYVESLEARLNKMDKILAKILPGIDISTLDVADDDTVPLPRNDDDELNVLANKMHKLRLNPQKHRFMGKSSGLQLVQTALDLRDEYISESNKGVEVTKGEEDKQLGRIPWSTKRKEYWEVPEWAESDLEGTTIPSYTYPPSNLLVSLVEAYFTHINPFFPLLHRPTFLEALEENKHLVDHTFGGTVLLVCALGAKYSDDPRVLAASGNVRSAGWKWFKQVNVLRTSLFERTSLHELQMYALSVFFAQTSEVPNGMWTQIGIALRLAQEVGAHRKRASSDGKPNAEDELWKRAFWVIMTLDRLISTASGRPCGLQEEDFDLDFPIDCDDEYWDYGFQQPLGKPSTMSFFNCYLSLMDILASATRAIYPIRGPKNLSGKALYRSDQQIITELDAAMNNWMDSVPVHLRWNPNCTNELFMKQSATLHAMYYNIQIFIHRPFIPSPQNPHPLNFPSLAISTNAARSCCHILESYSHFNTLPLPDLQSAAFQAAVILLLNIWSGKKSGMAPNPRREMEDVQRCMNILKDSEQRWSSAGRSWDMLAELACAGDLSIPTNTPESLQPSPENAIKSLSGCPDSASPATSAALSTPRSNSTPNSERKESEAANSSGMLVNIPFDEPMNFSLPMYSNELGRLPIYGQFSFSDSMNTSSDRFSGISVNGHTATAPSSASQPFTGGGFTQPPSGMDFNMAPRNLFTAADAFVKDALFNNQMSGGRSMFHFPQTAHPPPVDLSSIFTTVPMDYDNISQLYAASGMTAGTSLVQPAGQGSAGQGGMGSTDIVGGDDCPWPLVTNAATGYMDLVNVGILSLQQQQAAAGIYNNDQHQGGGYESHLNM